MHAMREISCTWFTRWVPIIAQKADFQTQRTRGGMQACSGADLYIPLHRRLGHLPFILSALARTDLVPRFTLQPGRRC